MTLNFYHKKVFLSYIVCNKPSLTFSYQAWWDYRTCRWCLFRGIKLLPLTSDLDTKPSDGEAPVLELWKNVEFFFTAITPSSTLLES